MDKSMYLIGTLSLIGAFAFRVIRNGFAIGSFKGWDSVTLSRALSSFTISVPVGLFGHISILTMLIFWGLLWLSFIPGIDPETSVAITGAFDSITQPLQWGIQWLSTKLNLPTASFWQRKCWGMLYTAIRFSVLIIPLLFLSFAISAPFRGVIGLAAPFLIAGAYCLAGFTLASDQRVPAELLAGAVIGAISGLVVYGH